MGSFAEEDDACEALLPPSSPQTPKAKKNKPNLKLGFIPLVFLIYFEVSGGPYGEESAVKAAGPLLAILGFIVFPFIWSIPEALITAELATAYPGNGGYVLWASAAFGPFWGFLMGWWKWVSGVINNAAYPALCLDYLKPIVPAFGAGAPRVGGAIIYTLIFSYLNYSGLNIVGCAAVILGVISLLPFLIMGFMSIPKIDPARWTVKNDKIEWGLYFNTLFWNLNFWDNASTLAGEVDNPQKTFPKALFYAGLMTVLGYVVPLVGATGALTAPSSAWSEGFLAEAAGIIGGRWLKIWIEFGAVLSTVGLFEAQLSSAAYQLLGMAGLGMVPACIGHRSVKYGTPVVGIIFSAGGTLLLSFVSFSNIVAASNFLYGCGMLLEFAAFLWLRRKSPALERPFRVPLETCGLLIMCGVPVVFLLGIMWVGNWVVYALSIGLTVLGVAAYFVIEALRGSGVLKFVSDVEEDENMGLGSSSVASCHALLLPQASSFSFVLPHSNSSVHGL